MEGVEVTIVQGGRQPGDRWAARRKGARESYRGEVECEVPGDQGARTCR